MSDTKTITKSLAGLEDILLGINTAQQNRAGQTVVVHKARIPVAVDNNTKLAAVDPTFSEYAVVVNSEGSSFYVYVPDTSGAVKSTVAAGSWKYEFVKSIMDIVDLAVYPKVGNFETGTIVHTNNEAVFYPGTVNLPFGTNTYWIYNGTIPSGGLIVPALSTPDSNWTNIGAGTNMDYFNKQFNDFKDYVNAALANNDVAKYQNMNVKLLGTAYSRLKQGQTLTIVCQGDSMTAGFDVTSNDKVPADNGDYATHAPIQYPWAVGYTLNGLTSASVTAINRGYSGDTAKVSYNRWTTNPNGHVMHLMLGINDAGGAGGATYEEYMDYMERIIRRYIDWGHGVVIHTCTAQNFNSAEPLSTRFSAGIRSLAKSYNCPIFDSELVTQYGIYDGIYSDGTHFNKQGYYKYGVAVAAAIMAGFWVGNGKPISGVYTQQPGRNSEVMGFFAKGSAGAYYTSGSYVFNGGASRFAAATNSSCSFAFYCDTEVMEVSVAGQLTGLRFSIASVASEDRPEYANRGVMSINRLTLRARRGSNIIETTGGLVAPGRGSAGRDASIGYCVGKGWKIVTFVVDASLTAEAYVNSIILKPSRMTSAQQTQVNNGKPADIQSFVAQQPTYGHYDDTTVVPPAVVLAVQNFPMPDGLYNWASSSSYFFDTGLAYLDILVRSSADAVANPNGIARFALYRVGSSETLTITKVYGTTNIIEPASAIIQKCLTDQFTGDLDPGGYVNGIPGQYDAGQIRLTFPTKTAAYYKFVLSCPSKSDSQASWLG